MASTVCYCQGFFVVLFRNKETFVGVIRMKVKVFSEIDPINKEIYFRLDQSDNRVLLVVVNPQTGWLVPCGTIASIDGLGHMYRHTGVNSNIGLRLDDEQRILIAKGETK